MYVVLFSAIRGIIKGALYGYALWYVFAGVNDRLEAVISTLNIFSP